jgi:hypothetical protein
MPKKLIYVGHKNFLIVGITEKSAKSLKSLEKYEGSTVELGTQCHR